MAGWNWREAWPLPPGRRWLALAGALVAWAGAGFGASPAFVLAAMLSASALVLLLALPETAQVALSLGATR